MQFPSQLENFQSVSHQTYFFPFCFFVGGGGSKIIEITNEASFFMSGALIRLLSIWVFDQTIWYWKNILEPDLYAWDQVLYMQLVRKWKKKIQFFWNNPLFAILYKKVSIYKKFECVVEVTHNIFLLKAGFLLKNTENLDI